MISDDQPGPHPAAFVPTVERLIRCCEQSSRPLGRRGSRPRHVGTDEAHYATLNRESQPV